jgi:hypothetical protein
MTNLPYQEPDKPNVWTYNRYRAQLCLNGEPVVVMAALNADNPIDMVLGDKIIKALNDAEVRKP